MSPALIEGQKSGPEFNSASSAKNFAALAVSKLMETRRSAVDKLTLAVDDLSEKLRLTTKDLIDERSKKVGLEAHLQRVNDELFDLQQKYAVLHSGLLKVLSDKFPGESDLSIEARLEALLLASNSGAMLGEQPNFTTSEAQNFISQITDSL